jgi:prolyl-tRNA synthetase
MLGALIMTHSDDNGLVLPPTVAPIKVVLVPIFSNSNKDKVLTYAKDVYKQLEGQIEELKLDNRDFVSPGFKFNEWEKKGVPIRIEIGEREIKNGTVVVVRRDTLEKKEIKFGDLKEATIKILEEIQENLYERSKQILVSKTYRVDDYNEFKNIFSKGKGFVRAGWCGDEKCEENIKYDTKATTRCLTKDGEGVKGRCIYCGKESENEWIFAKAY